MSIASAFPHLPDDRPQGRRRGAGPDQGERGRRRGLSRDRRPDRPVVALTRWPAVHLLPADWFYLDPHRARRQRAAVLDHLLRDRGALFRLRDPAQLPARGAEARPGLGFVLMVVGALLANVAVLQGNSSVMFTSYPPMQAAPHFYLGLILFAVGALIGCAVFFATLVIAKDEKTYEGSIPLVTFGALTAAIIAVFTIASGAIILIPTWLWSHRPDHRHRPADVQGGVVGRWAIPRSRSTSRRTSRIWYMIAALLVGAKPLSEKVSRTAFLMYILFLQLASAHHLLAEPGRRSSWKIVNTSYMMYLAVLGSMIHGLTVPGAIEAAQRTQRLQQGRVRVAAQGAVGQPGLRRHVPVAGLLRLHRRHLRRRARHRAAQRADAQHAVRAGPLPRHGGRRHDARLHGVDLPRAAADLPARDHLPDARQVAALSVRHRRRRHLAVHDGRRHARRAAAALGHHVHRRRCHSPIPPAHS